MTEPAGDPTKYRVERHWACIVEADGVEDAFDKAMIKYAEDYGIKEADWMAIRLGLKGSLIAREVVPR